MCGLCGDDESPRITCCRKADSRDQRLRQSNTHFFKVLFSETCQISCRSQIPSELECPKILAAECLGFGYMVMKGLARGSKDID